MEFFFIAITLLSTASIATSYGGMGQLIEGEQQIGWMAMKGYINQILDINPLKVVYVFDPRECSTPLYATQRLY